MSAILIKEARPTEAKLRLGYLRSKIRSFHPPQFMLRIDPLGKLKTLLNAALFDGVEVEAQQMSLQLT
jgi:hypothetical protein